MTAQSADSVLARKENQPDLLDDMVDCFTLAEAEQFAGVDHDQHIQTTKAHGRLETHAHPIRPHPR